MHTLLLTWNHWHALTIVRPASEPTLLATTFTDDIRHCSLTQFVRLKWLNCAHSNINHWVVTCMTSIKQLPRPFQPPAVNMAVNLLLKFDLILKKLLPGV